jgi:hypothetical protein
MSMVLLTNKQQRAERSWQEGPLFPLRPATEGPLFTQVAHTRERTGKETGLTPMSDASDFVETPAVTVTICEPKGIGKGIGRAGAYACTRIFSAKITAHDEYTHMDAPVGALEATLVQRPGPFFEGARESPSRASAPTGHGCPICTVLSPLPTTVCHVVGNGKILGYPDIGALQPAMQRAVHCRSSVSSCLAPRASPATRRSGAMKMLARAASCTSQISTFGTTLGVFLYTYMDVDTHTLALHVTRNVHCGVRGLKTILGEPQPRSHHNFW